MNHGRLRWILVLAGTLVGLLIAEGGVRLFDWDWQYAERWLPLFTLHGGFYEIDEHPDLHYRLIPGTHRFQRYSAFVNSVNARCPERPLAKPPDVVRVAVVGGSNVFGVNVEDDETWPARLEQRLREAGPGVEVWNFGDAAYNTAQMVTRAGWVLEHLAPDLIVVALSNFDNPFFLPSPENEILFDGMPVLWYRTVFDLDDQGDGPLLSAQTRLRWITRSRLFRLALLARMEQRAQHRRPPQPGETWGRAKLRLFIRSTAAQTRTAVFICPAVRPSDFAGYADGTGAPTLILPADQKPADAPDTWLDIHPPAGAMEWYANALAPWLREQGLVAPFAAEPSP